MGREFYRSEMLLGSDAMQKLHESHVAVVGLGGVGSFAAEALARAGVGVLTLVDNDAISETNINRQLVALHSTLGRSKAEVMGERILDINPNISLHIIKERYCATSRENFFSERFSYIIDAIDLVTDKLDLINSAKNFGIPIISALGTGNKFDASRLVITDISKTRDCSFAKVIRKELRTRGVLHHTIIYSPELPKKAVSEEAPPPGRRSIPGSLIWVPASVGLMLAGHVVMSLAGIKADTNA
jgi:Dinucleotide-utilizing enzymes involved in molybdopterin and thiamine biosynthesis family 1